MGKRKKAIEAGFLAMSRVGFALDGDDPADVDERWRRVSKKNKQTAMLLATAFADAYDGAMTEEEN